MAHVGEEHRVTLRYDSELRVSLGLDAGRLRRRIAGLGVEVLKKEEGKKVRR